MQSLRVALWNVEWRVPTSHAAQAIRRRLETWIPDIVCLTESYADLLPGGHRIEAEEDYGYGFRPGRRKVLLWSQCSWREVDQVGSSAMPPGRFVSGMTETPLGPIEVLGVYIPWSHAHVTGGRRDRKPWEEHVDYVESLAPLLAREPGRPRILLGDFNQRIPRISQPERAYSALARALGPRFSVATAGVKDATGRAAVDHLAHTTDLTAKAVGELPRREAGGPRISDHFDLVLDISQADPPPAAC